MKTQRSKLILSLSNIFKKATEAMEKKYSNKTLTIDVNTKNDKIYIKISDNREGIPKENPEKILHQGFTAKEKE